MLAQLVPERHVVGGAVRRRRARAAIGDIYDVGGLSDFHSKEQIRQKILRRMSLKYFKLRGAEQYPIIFGSSECKCDLPVREFGDRFQRVQIYFYGLQKTCHYCFVNHQFYNKTTDFLCGWERMSHPNIWSETKQIGFSNLSETSFK